MHLRTKPLHKQHTPTLCSQWFTHYCFTNTQLDIPPKLTTSVTVPWEQGGGIKQDCSRNNTWACLIQATHLRPAKASLWARLTTRTTPSSAGKQAYKSIPHADLCRKKQTTKLCNCERKADLHSRATSKANYTPKLTNQNPEKGTRWAWRQCRKQCLIRATLLLYMEQDAAQSLCQARMLDCCWLCSRMMWYTYKHHTRELYKTPPLPTTREARCVHTFNTHRLLCWTLQG